VRKDGRKYLMDRIAVNPRTGCWEWTGGYFAVGYGYFKCRSVWPKPINAHRGAWMVMKGNPGDKWVLHKCDNRGCCNPDHLFLGTQSDNMQDCSKKGRINRGEDRPQAKLTEEQVKSMRRRRDLGATYRDLIAEFGVSKSSVHRIVHHETWTHV
jgi:hypothetical protein